MAVKTWCLVSSGQISALWPRAWAMVNRPITFCSAVKYDSWVTFKIRLADFPVTGFRKGDNLRECASNWSRLDGVKISTTASKRYPMAPMNTVCMISYANSPPNRRPGIDSVAREQSWRIAVHVILGCNPRRRRDLPDVLLWPFSAASCRLVSRSSLHVYQEVCKIYQDVYYHVKTYAKYIKTCIIISRRTHNISRCMRDIKTYIIISRRIL